MGISSDNYSRLDRNRPGLVGEDDFGAHDDLLGESAEEEDARVLHDQGNFFLHHFILCLRFLLTDISKASTVGSSKKYAF